MQQLDRVDRVVGRADDRATRFDCALRRLGHTRHKGLQGVAEVIELPGAPTLAAFGEGLLARLGDVHRQHHAPLVAVHLLVVALGRLLNLTPLSLKVAASTRQVDADAEHADAVLPCDLTSGGRDRAGHGHLEVRLRVRRHLEPRVDQLEPVTLDVDRPILLEQRHDRFERLVHALTLVKRVDPHHRGVRRKRARSDAHHRATASHVIELDHAVDHHQRVVIRQADHAGAEADVASALRGSGDEDLG